MENEELYIDIDDATVQIIVKYNRYRGYREPQNDYGEEDRIDIISLEVDGKLLTTYREMEDYEEIVIKEILGL